MTQHYEQKAVAYGMSHTRRDRILGLIEPTARRVLDVGCARGYLGALVRRSGVWVGGVELSHQAAEIARTNLDDVWSFDVQDQWPQELQRGDIDVVICSEVIEHVFDPLPLLRSIHAALASGGTLILTTPNFLTWTNRLRFLFGRFRYQDQGMFDFGHIRWFTYAYLMEMLRKASFDVTVERHIIFPGKLTRVVSRWPSLFAWQFVVKAQKK